jgi:transcriptional regulator with XRE-family HTH domain
MSDVVLDKAISRAIGEELRRARDAIGWTRAQLVARLPSGIGDRTLLSYEHGARHLTVLRLIELCRVLQVGAPHLLGLALQRARVVLENLTLWVDLRALLADNTAKFSLMLTWAHRTLVQHPDGVVEVVPAVVETLATMIGCPRADLTAYLVRFVPDLDQIPDKETYRVLATV